MRLTTIEIKDFQAVTDVTIRPGERGLLCLGGENESGKSSVLRALDTLFGGKIPLDPVHHGADEAVIVGTLHDDDGTELTVKRRIGPDRKSKQWVITDGDGRKDTAPAKWLARRIGDSFIDPLEFLRAKPAVQREKLLSCLGIGDELSKLNAERKSAYDQRTAKNTLLKAEKATLERIGSAPEVPPVVDVSALTAKLREAQAHNGARAEKKREIDAVEERITSSAGAIADQEQEVRDLEAKLAAQKERLERYRSAASQLSASAEQLRAEYDGMAPEADTFDIEADLDAATERNDAHATAAQQRAQWDGAKEKAGALKKDSDALTTRIAEIDQKKEDAVKSADIPVEGLGVDDDGVTYNGVPFESASDARRRQVSMAVAAALRPNLRAIWCKDGALLDDKAMAELAAWAEEQDMLLVLERVGARDDGALIIEEGRL